MEDRLNFFDPEALLTRWRELPACTYRSWFLWEERIKNFRSIRRGLQAVVQEIESGVFGNAYRGSSLETVVAAIAEQRQIFKGADHAFLWKPKLRIPDIYENPQHQRTFGRFLDACDCCDTEEGVLSAIRTLDQAKIKGLGPAAANLLYFIHPTLVLPFNTAIVNGYNALTGAKVKLGRWEEYLAMRHGALALNARYRPLLSNDLGAIAGFLFDIGAGRLPLPPRENDATAQAAWEADLAKVRDDAAAQRLRIAQSEEDQSHTQVQGWLRDLGKALGFNVWVASNDRSRPYGDGRLADGCLDTLPPVLESSLAVDSIRLIDVLWLEPDGHVAAAFEVEHSTSIYSGIVRMLDLALGANDGLAGRYFLVAPDRREADARAQFARPAFQRVSELDLRFLPYSELQAHRESMARFGQGLRPIEALARPLR
ncbi:MAG: type II restriction endonuclease [Proteobacteria bacterium]|nr:type II restriction endonuclease [Pseudomonadota bacterium]